MESTSVAEAFSPHAIPEPQSLNALNTKASHTHPQSRKRSATFYRRKRARLQPRPRTPSARSPTSAAIIDMSTANPAGPPPVPASPKIATATAHVGRTRHSRAQPSHSAIEETIAHPGTVLINVQGAFIVPEDQEPTTPQSEDYEHDPRDIRLPNHTSIVSHVAVDIGGSLAKLVYFSREADSAYPGGRLNFLKFETERIDTCIDFMRTLQADYKQLTGPNDQELCVMATGGGAFKYYDRIKEALGIEVQREDEMECLIIGLDFFITEIPNEVFTYSEDTPMNFIQAPIEPAAIYPYLLVNIGSGVSMIKVSGPRQYERIGGTSLGGGTLWGLLSLLTGARNFEDMLNLAEKGDNSTVDLLVGDIYGTAYNKIGLKSTHIASSFGKVYKMKRAAERDAEDGCNAPFKYTAEEEHIHEHADAPTEVDETTHSHSRALFKPEDISRSLLYAVSNNIGQIAYLHAEKHNLPHIYFGGSFIGGHHQTMNTLSYAIKFWSKGTKQAYFLRHEGYLGAVGAFLKRQPQNWGRRNSEARSRRPSLERGDTVRPMEVVFRERERSGA